jgi:hypothetical protein
LSKKLGDNTTKFFSGNSGGDALIKFTTGTGTFDDSTDDYTAVYLGKNNIGMYAYNTLDVYPYTGYNRWRISAPTIDGGGVGDGSDINFQYSHLNTAGDGYNAFVINVEDSQAGATGEKNIVVLKLDSNPIVKISSVGDIELMTSTQGLILKSPNDTRFRITVNNDGSLSTTSL